MAPMKLKSAALGLLGFTSIAIALPLFDTLGQGAAFFIEHGASTKDIVIFAFSVYLLPALALFAITLLFNFFNPSIAKIFLSLALGTLAGLWAMGVANAFPESARIITALTVAVLVGWGYYGNESLRGYLQVLGIVSPLVLFFFLVLSPVNEILVQKKATNSDDASALDIPVVVLVLDELSQAAITTPDGNIDTGRLPNFARLEQMSTWYSNTTTASTQTEKAVPAILSGRRVGESTQPVFNHFPQNLFSILAASHKIRAFETVTRLCPSNICKKSNGKNLKRFDTLSMYRDSSFVWLHTVAPADVAERYLPTIANSWKNFDLKLKNDSSDSGQNWFLTMVTDLAINQRMKFGKFIAGIRSGGGTHLHYLHLALPHIPWIYLPDGTLYNGNFAPGQSAHSYDWSNDQNLVDQGVLRYSLQIEYVDLLLGELLDSLIATGQLDKVMLVVVSDHGLAFTPGDQRRTPSPSTLADVSRVPLFIKYSMQSEKKRDIRKVETIDILPTIADSLGLSLDGPVDGQSLLSNDWRPRTRYILEAGKDIADIEGSMDMTTASHRIYRVVQPGLSATESMGMHFGRPYFGKAVSTTNTAKGQSSLSLDRPELYEKINTKSGFIPARLTGTLRETAVGTEILISLNGTIAGGGTTYSPSGEFSIMLDPRQFRDGVNRLKAYLLEEGELFQLTIASRKPSWTITRRAKGRVVVTDAAGVQYRNSKKIRGHAAYSSNSSAIASLGGSAYDHQNAKAAQTLLLLDGEEVLSSGFRMYKNPLAAAQSGISEGLAYWFSLEMDAELEARKSSLTVVALFEGGHMLEIHPK